MVNPKTLGETEKDNPTSPAFPRVRQRPRHASLKTAVTCKRIGPFTLVPDQHSRTTRALHKYPANVVPSNTHLAICLLFRDCNTIAYIRNCLRNTTFCRRTDTGIDINQLITLFADLLVVLPSACHTKTIPVATSLPTTTVAIIFRPGLLNLFTSRTT